VSLVLRRGMRVALAGAHGSGKSLLLQLLSGMAEPLSGTVTAAPGAAPVPPEPPAKLLEEPTVRAAAERALAPLRELERHIRALEHRLDAPGAFAEYALLTEQFERAGGYTAEADLRALLAAFGFPAETLDLPPGFLSAGELRRVQLAGILSAGAPVLLLDQPDLDLTGEMRQAAARRLKGWRGAVLFSSHDREFIRESCTHVAELADGSLRLRRGTFTLKRHFQTVRGHGASARPLFSSDGLQLPLPGGQLLRTGPLAVRPGERILVTGPPGSGRKELLRFLARDHRSGRGAGSGAWHGPVSVMHMDAHLFGLDGALSAAENLERHMSPQRAGQLLELTGFTRSGRQQAAGDLPVRERARAGLALLFGADVDLLLIEAAGEHLDLPRRQLLGEALAAREGALIFSSADRFLARSIALRVWDLTDGRLADYRGGVAGWEHGRLRLEPDAEAPPQDKPAAPAPETAPDPRDVLEERLLALEDLLAEAPLKNNPELTRRLERRRTELTGQLMAAYASGLPEPAPRFRVREADRYFEADRSEDGSGLEFSPLAGSRAWLRVTDSVAHLGVDTPADRCLLPRYRAALINAAVRLTFQLLPVSAVQHFDRSPPPGLLLHAAGNGWHVLNVADFERLEGWRP